MFIDLFNDLTACTSLYLLNCLERPFSLCVNAICLLSTHLFILLTFFLLLTVVPSQQYFTDHFCNALAPFYLFYAHNVTLRPFLNSPTTLSTYNDNQNLKKHIKNHLRKKQHCVIVSHNLIRKIVHIPLTALF